MTEELMIAPKEKKTLGLPMVGCVWVSDKPSCKDVVRFTVSCHGGGWDGSSWQEYVFSDCIDTEQYGNIPMIVCKRVNGERVTINPSYIVEAENFTLVQATYVCSNRYYKPGRYTISMIAHQGQKLSLVSSVDEYRGRDGSRDSLYVLSEKPERLV